MKLTRLAKHSLMVAMTAMTAVAFSGCRGGLLGSSTYRDVHYYALRTPQGQAYDGYNLDISSLRMLAAGRNKMVYRDASCQVLIDDYNKWVQSPSFLIRQYLQTFFASPESNTAVPVELTLKGSVVIFEINLQSREAVLGVEYTIMVRNDVSMLLQNSIIVKEKFEGDTPDSFAEAMSRAADRFCAVVAKDAVQMKQRVKAAETAAAAVTDAAAKAAEAASPSADKK